MALLSIKDLSISVLKSSTCNDIVRRVNLQIEPGEFLGLVGESGCGKSTLAGAILRILQPPLCITRGSITVADQDILKMPDHAVKQLRWKKIAMVFQSAMNCLNPVLDVQEQLIDTLQAHGCHDETKNLNRILEVIAMVELESTILNRYPHQLSGGMRQRVNIAMALLLNPKLLILDEPTTALDVVTQKQILTTIHRLQKTHDFSVLMISHDLPVVLDFCDRAAVMKDGKIVEIAERDQIIDHPQHPYTHLLLNSFPSIFA